MQAAWCRQGRRRQAGASIEPKAVDGVRTRGMKKLSRHDARWRWQHQAGPLQLKASSRWRNIQASMCDLSPTPQRIVSPVRPPDNLQPPLCRLSQLKITGAAACAAAAESVQSHVCAWVQSIQSKYSGRWPAPFGARLLRSMCEKTRQWSVQGVCDTAVDSRWGNKSDEGKGWGFSKQRDMCPLLQVSPLTAAAVNKLPGQQPPGQQRPPPHSAA